MNERRLWAAAAHLAMTDAARVIRAARMGKRRFQQFGVTQNFTIGKDEEARGPEDQQRRLADGLRLRRDRRVV